MQILADNLKHIRKQRGWTQEKVAQRVHVDRTTYTKYESGAANPSLDTLLLLCAVLEVTPNDLLEKDTENT